MEFALGRRFVKTRPRAPAGVRIYAIGDIHGRLDLLEQLQAKIEADARDAGDLKIVQVFLGDYVDRGSNSKGVIDFLIKSPLPGWDRTCLKGNHETMMSRFLEEATTLDMWGHSGGLETVHSYGAGLSKTPSQSREKKIRNQFAKKIPKAHRNFFSGLKLSAEFGDYFFVHAGVRPGVALDAQAERDLLWIRKEFVTSKMDFGKVIVHGHTPVAEPEVLFNRINIDTGAFKTNCLTCLVLEGDSQRFL